MTLKIERDKDVTLVIAEVNERDYLLVEMRGKEARIHGDAFLRVGMKAWLVE